MNIEQYEIKIHFSIKQIKKETWNDCLEGIANPFYDWDWLLNLEKSKSVSRGTGWQPLYFSFNLKNELLAIAPLFLKNHSYGEFIFDQSFVRLAEDLNIQYYPKLIGMSPYSPVEGYKFIYKKDSPKLEITKLLILAIEDFAKKNNILSCNFLYVDSEWSNYLIKLGYHNWNNIRSEWGSRGESSFEDFLNRFNSNQRKNIKKERKSIINQGIKIKIIENESIDLKIIQKVHAFYEMHCAKWGVWGSKYLTAQFFESLLSSKDKILIFGAFQESHQDIIAMSMCIKSKDYLWGRYWGSESDIKNLHFELCYYQPIEWAIKNNINFFDPGAGGNQKRRRGFYAKQTISLHKWFDKNMDLIISEWIKKVNHQTIYEIKTENSSIPFTK